MSLIEPGEKADVLDRVKSWPAAERFALVKDILCTLVPEANPLASRCPRGRPVEEILASFMTDLPAPDDETVRRWIDEQRMDKYG